MSGMIKPAHLLALAMALPLAALPTVAHAQDAAAPATAGAPDEAASGPWSIDGEVGAFSDYRFRGISLSGKDPEATAELTVSHESGLYAGAWVSNVDLGDGADDAEVDLSAGYSTELGKVALDVGAVYYLYPGNSSFNYVEFYSSLGTKVGPADVTVGVAYAPAQGNLGDADNTYVYISGDMPIGETPLSVHGTFGIEDGAFADHKKDWLVGASYDLGTGFTATLDYVDTAHSFTSLGAATAVFSITKSF